MSEQIIANCMMLFLVISAIGLILIIVFYKYKFMDKLIKLYPIIGIIIIFIMIWTILKLLI